MIYHEPVLLKEVLEYLRPEPNDNFIDGTLGNGGHALALLKLITPSGRLLGIDLNRRTIEMTQERINAAASQIGDRLILVKDNFNNLEQIVSTYKFYPVKGILLDLGFSSSELADPERGFSFEQVGPLDMRYGDTRLTAKEIVNHWSERELSRIFKEYGEERYARLIARAMVEARKIRELETTTDLVRVIERVYRGKPKPKIHFATKIFQSLRIAVNDELNNLKLVLPAALKVLAPAGRLAIISFHSLEDKIVKDFFKQESKGCLCPPSLPICHCGHEPSLKIITKKPIRPSQLEIKNNPRSRSAKMRVAEKI